MGMIAVMVTFVVYLVGPGVIAGLAVANPRRYLWLAIISLVAFECWAWSPDFDVWLVGHLPICFSVPLGLFCGLLCTGRQHQDQDDEAVSACPTNGP